MLDRLLPVQRVGWQTHLITPNLTPEVIMRIHSDVITGADIFRAERIARVSTDKCDRKGSRSRDHAYDVTLTGESRRRPNLGTSRGRSYDGYAATWDQWGVFLSVLFDVDPNATSTYYDGKDDFDLKTFGRFQPHGSVSSPYGSPGSEIPNYWPADAHGDHTFRFDGKGITCTKCSARQR